MWIWPFTSILCLVVSQALYLNSLGVITVYYHHLLAKWHKIRASENLKMTPMGSELEEREEEDGQMGALKLFVTELKTDSGESLFEDNQ